MTATDAGLGVAAIALVLATLLVPGRRGPVLCFLGLGVVMTLVWLRLGSVDVALAEAALGTGVLSALLVTLALRTPAGPPPDTAPQAPPGGPPWVRLVLGGLGGVAGVLVLAEAWRRARLAVPRWEEAVTEQLPSTGVSHPVTAVLLGFRAYDTLLESAVLMLAGIVVLTLSRDVRVPAPRSPSAGSSTTLSWSVRLMAAPVLLVALWILLAGSSSPGGAFQSGAVAAGLLILLRTVGVPLRILERHALLPLLVVGVIVFVLAGLLGPVTGSVWLDWGETAVFAVVLAVEVLLTAGITAGLYLLHLGLAQPAGEDRA